jgi:hypothetical protein
MCRLAAPAVAGCGLVSPGICHCWLPVWLPHPGRLAHVRMNRAQYRTSGKNAFRHLAERLDPVVPTVLDHQHPLALAQRWDEVAGEPRHGRFGAGLWPTISARPGSPSTTCRKTDPSSYDSRSTRSGSIARVASRSAPFAAWRQRSSTDDRNPAATVIGIWSRPAARRKTSSIWVAFRAGRETNATCGRVLPFPADHLGGGARGVELHPGTASRPGIV